MRIRCTLLFAVTAASLALPTSSCGYTAGLAPERAGGVETRTIGVEIFGNQTFVPNLERGLHEALSTAARRHANLTLVSPERADVVIRGNVVDFRRQQGARTTGNRFVEARDVITVDATLTNGSSGAVVARTRTEVGFGTAIDVAGREPAARDNVLRNSADRILLTLLAELEYGRARAPLPDEPPVGPSADSSVGVPAAPSVGLPTDPSVGVPADPPVDPPGGPPEGR